MNTSVTMIASFLKWQKVVPYCLLERNAPSESLPSTSLFKYFLTIHWSENRLEELSRVNLYERL